MEAYRVDGFGSVDGIVLRSSEDPRPGPKEILMRVRASSLNYRDLMVLRRRSCTYQARGGSVFRGCGRGCRYWRRGDAGPDLRPNCRLLPSAVVRGPDQA